MRGERLGRGAGRHPRPLYGHGRGGLALSTHHAFDAKVKVTSRKTGKTVELTVPAGGYTWTRVD